MAMFQIMVAFFLASLFLNTFVEGGQMLVMLSTGFMIGFALACGAIDKEPRFLEPTIEGNMLIEKAAKDPSFKASDRLRQMFRDRIDKIIWRIEAVPEKLEKQ